MSTHNEPTQPAKQQSNQKKSALGRGLGSLISSDPNEYSGSNFGYSEEQPGLPKSQRETMLSDKERVWQIAIEKIHPAKNQPRKYFDKIKIKELADSIKEQGVLQPLIVRKVNEGHFELIAGERRWRAAQQAGLHQVPVILKETDDKTLLEWALIENIQREDLNPIEEAQAYEILISTYQLSQQDVAKRVGKERATVANALRLLRLPKEIQEMLVHGDISSGHAKALLMLSETSDQIEIGKKIVEQGLSVRAAESFAQRWIKQHDQANNQEGSAGDLGVDVSKRLVAGLQDELQKMLGTKVLIEYQKSKGKIIVHYYSDDELTQIIDKFRRAWRG